MSSSDAARAGAALNAASVVETARMAAMNLRDMVGPSRDVVAESGAILGAGHPPEKPVRSISEGCATSGNNALWLLDSSTDVIEFQGNPAQVGRMKRVFYSLLFVLFSLPVTAQAACYADYKAKQDAPLRLHYGVAQINGPCTTSNAARELQTRLQQAGWTLLNVVSVFDDSGLAERKDSAGPHYLRY